MTPGLEPGGGVRPGETPPVEGGTAEAVPESEALRHAWGPVPLVVILALTAAMAVLFVVMGAVLLAD